MSMRFYTAKIEVSFQTSKYWSSECRGKLAFALLSRDKIRPLIK